MIKIRLYKKSDQAEIDKMIDSIATEFELPISNPNKANIPLLDKYWVSLHNNEIIGTIGVLKLDGEFSILKKMFVKREYRGKEYGIASLLLNKVFDWCNSQSIDTIYLGTMSQFKAAHKFYEKNGFETISINKLPSSFVTNPIDDVFYKKNNKKIIIIIITLYPLAMITYQVEKNLTAEEFIDVLNKSTLGERRPVDEPERILKMLEHGNLIITARENNVLIGVARSLTDYLFCTYLSDLAVDQTYQKQGIGKELIKLTKLETPSAKLILLSAPKAVAYYPKIGMTKWEQCFVLDNVDDLK